MDGGAKRILERTGYPRRRAVAACSTCRERKRKCDNLRPTCSSCQHIGAQCEYTKQDASSFDAASLTIIDRLSVIESLLRDIHPSSTADISSSPARFSHQTSPNLPTSIHPSQENVSSKTEPAAFTLNLNASLRVATDQVLQWPVFEQCLSPLRRFKYVNFNGSESYTYLGDLQSNSNTSTSRSLLEHSWKSSAGVNVSTERTDIEELVDRYFRNSNSNNPILSRRVVSGYCQRYYDHGPLFDLETCLVMLMCAVGALSPELVPMDVSQSPESPSHPPSHPSARLVSLRLGRGYFVAAEKRLGGAVFNISTLAIQCLYLVGTYHMYTINPLLALRAFHAAGSSLQILLSTGADLAEGASQENSSLFWACYKAERFVCHNTILVHQHLNLSREILAEMPIAAPALREPVVLDSYLLTPQATSNSSDEWAMSEEGSWYFLLSEIALRRITNEVADVVAEYIDAKVHRHHSPGIEELMPIVAEFERQVETFRDFLHPSLKFPDAPEGASSDWKQYSRGRYYRALELMHRPFVFTAIHQPGSCSPAVLALAEKGLTNALRYLQHSHMSHRHHGTWLQFRNGLKAAILLLAASRSLSPLTMPDGWNAGIAKTLAIFDYWSWEFPACKSYTDVIRTLSQLPLTHTDGDNPISQLNPSIAEAG